MNRKLEVTILTKPKDDGLISVNALNEGDVFKWPDSTGIGLKTIVDYMQLRGIDDGMYLYPSGQPTDSLRVKLLGKLVGITVKPY